MQSQRGNFLLQALLALTLVFAFVPLLASRLTQHNVNAQMYSATHQIEVAQTAARIYVLENANDLPFDTTILAGNKFADTLESYGLPLGFIPHNALGQDMSLVIEKQPEIINAYLVLSGGDLSELQLAELARRVGFYAAVNDNKLYVGLALDSVYSDVVRRNETNLDNDAFLTDLDMGGNVFDNAGTIIARRGEFDTAEFNTLSIVGTESGRKVKNNIASILSDKTIFQSRDGETALTLSRGNLTVGAVDARTVSKLGDTGNFTAHAASVRDFTMTAGRTSFAGPAQWNVRGNLVTDNISFSVERLEINSFLNAARGQDVFIDSDDLSYSTNSGIDVNTIAASNITLRDQTSAALDDGQTGVVILDLRPAGTSVLPDIAYNKIDNGVFAILDRPAADDGKTIDCKALISQVGARYNAHSVAQYVLCQYAYWARLEQRIKIKQCLLGGNGDCM